MIRATKSNLNGLILMILLVALVLRLYRIDQPLIDAFSWRQTSTAMMAENLYRQNWNILYPEVNWSGPGPNYRGREFQTVAYISALLYTIFDQQDWIGRGVSIAFSLLGVFALYQLVRRIWDEERALLAAAILAVIPVSIFIDRSFLPDPAMVALITTSFWMVMAFLQTNKLRYLILACFSGSLGLLTKIPGLIIGLPIAYAAIAVILPDWKRRYRDVFLLLGAAIVVLAPVVAYYQWAIYLARTYPPYHFAGWGNWIWNYGLSSWWSERFFISKLSHHTIDWLWTAPVLLLALAGILIPLFVRSKRAREGPTSEEGRNTPWVFHYWILAGLIYYAIGAWELVNNPWNLHILSPAFAALAAQGTILVSKQVGRLLRFRKVQILHVGFVLLISSVWWKSTDFLYWSYAKDSMQVGLALQAISEPDDLVMTIAESVGDTVGTYYSRRRGWVFPPPPTVDWGMIPEDDETSIQLFEELRAQGADWFGIVNLQYDQLWADHRVLAEYISRASKVQVKTEGYVILRLLQPEEYVVEGRKCPTYEMNIKFGCRVFQAGTAHSAKSSTSPRQG
jgi:4-amino-4-deoxy-L-arabinose transferase-like glycosyltransferase